MKKFLLLKVFWTVIIGALAFGLNLIIQSQEIACWGYALAGVIIGLIFFHPIVDESFEALDRFIKISLLSVAGLLIIVFISTLGTFDGPYGYFCSWPTLFIALAIIVFDVVISVITTYRLSFAINVRFFRHPLISSES